MPLIHVTTRSRDEKNDRWNTDRNQVMCPKISERGAFARLVQVLVDSRYAPTYGTMIPFPYVFSEEP